MHFYYKDTVPLWSSVVLADGRTRYRGRTRLPARTIWADCAGGDVAGKTRLCLTMAVLSVQTHASFTASLFHTHASGSSHVARHCNHSESNLCAWRGFQLQPFGRRHLSGIRTLLHSYHLRVGSAKVGEASPTSRDSCPAAFIFCGDALDMYYCLVEMKLPRCDGPDIFTITC